MDAQEPKLERCMVTVDCDGQATAIYRIEGNQVDGRESHDEDVSEWSDKDVIDLFASLCGFTAEDKAVVEIWWD